MENIKVQTLTDGVTEVNYQSMDNGVIIEIEGTLARINTGRLTDYTFEPSFFLNDQSESFYDENWERIEDAILSEFYSTRKTA